MDRVQWRIQKGVGGGKGEGGGGGGSDGSVESLFDSKVQLHWNFLDKSDGF